jgi:hypothetical protein
MREPFFFDPEALDLVADREREAYARAKPFPHVVLDGLLPDELLDEVVREAPKADERPNWVRVNDVNSVKRGLRDDWTMGPTTRLLLGQFNSAAFLNFLERLTGMSGLVGDPHLFGGGIHTIESGGYLRIHADFNQHPRLNLLRRINALLYLNRDWDDEWGGHLELWDRDLSNRGAMIAPIFNRLVIFSITDTAYHGHPNPLETPPGIARRSLALYYYSAAEGTEAHSTLWQPGVGERIPRPADAPDEVTRPTEDPVPTHSEHAEPAQHAEQAQEAERPSSKQAAREWVPPVLWRAAHRLKASLGR